MHCTLRGMDCYARFTESAGADRALLILLSTVDLAALAHARAQLPNSRLTEAGTFLALAWHVPLLLCAKGLGWTMYHKQSSQFGSSPAFVVPEIWGLLFALFGMPGGIVEFGHCR